ncbi:hypothetical protein HMPREF1317_0335 [Schaalia georgiae F0490]|uniref:Protoporphyrinogen oxidase n=1 Tax=Schaalia georgiae F0490 TaxID=1125717 RepID=J1GS56_9ACTO|nr:hypothetical protein HMPREF1317_0335 [Schaalia georgiae F0490]
MGMKIGIVLGFGVGYVLGARAGRERYEQIRATASRLRRAPVVARPLDAAGQRVSDIVRAGGEHVTDKVADAVKERLFGAPASADGAGDAAAPAPQSGTAPASHGAQVNGGAVPGAGAPASSVPRSR